MTDVAEPVLAATTLPDRRIDFSVRLRSSAEYLVIPLIALGASAVLFALFLLALGKSPIEFFQLIVRGGFGTPFSIQNTLQRSSPLILTALAALKTLKEKERKPKKSLEMVALCEEEDSRFHCNFWGTRGMLGLISESEMDELRDEQGVSIGAAVLKITRAWAVNCVPVASPSFGTTV